MYSDSRDRAETISTPDETSPLLSASSKAAESHTSWSLPAFLRRPSKKKHDVEERSTGPENSEEESGETRDNAPSKNVSIMSFIAVLYFGILPRTIIG